MNCTQCGGALSVGAVLCSGCGAPAPVASAAQGPQALAVVEGGDVATRVPLPAEGQELLLGRHDLTQSPPWVVDVDLGRLMKLSAGEGPPVSRNQAVLSRRAGQVLLTPKGAAAVLHRPNGKDSYSALPANQAHPVATGDRVAFGHGARALVLEAR